MNNKIVIYIIVIAVLILGAFYFFNSNKTTQQNQMPAVQMPTSQTNTQDQTPVTQLPANTQNQAPVAPTPNANSNTNQVAPVQAVSAKTYNVSIANFAFSVSTLNVNKGDTVVWTNNDSVPHQIKGDTLGSLSGPVMSNGQTYSYTFNDAGTFSYHCAIHPSMTANIIVK